MKTFDFYEFAGVLAPGALTLYGLTLVYPGWQPLIEGKQFTVGDLGLFVVLAYVVGHLIQALGNLIEQLFWALQGGMPTDWLRTNRHQLLAPTQVALLLKVVPTKLGIELPSDLRCIDARAWSSITGQMYTAVKHREGTARIDIFNANYGMFRGIASALLVVAIAQLAGRHFQYPGVLILLITGIVLALARMRRFGRHYARELFLQFLQLP